MSLPPGTEFTLDPGNAFDDLPSLTVDLPRLNAWP